MALINFSVRLRQAIQFAECLSVPPVMIIAGQNGIGKSTLLYAIKEGIGEKMYRQGFFTKAHIELFDVLMFKDGG